jgi:hypothetical protein
MKWTRLNVGSVVLLVLLALLIVLWLERRGVAVDLAAGDALLKVEHAALRDNHARAAVLIVIALFSFLVWTVLMRGGQDDAPAGKGESERRQPPTPPR